MTTVAAVQMASGPSVSANLLEAGRLIAHAAHGGAELIVLPENFALMGMTEHDKLHIRESATGGPIQDFLAQQATRYGVWLVGGTIPLVANHDAHKVRASCLVFNAEGAIVGRYDKIHLFDVHIDETNEQYTESATIEAGDSTTVLDTPCGRLGLAICYDLRFPELFRHLAATGVDLIAVPSAFTAVTGRAHWEVLVRARAVENLCYVVASAQGGYHLNGRETYGHSLIADPWGTVLDELPSGSGLAQATIEIQRVDRIRRSFPALQHRRMACD